MLKAVLSGRGDEIIDLAEINLFRAAAPGDATMATNQQVTQSGLQEGSRGMGLLECPGLNKGMAFTEEERWLARPAAGPPDRTGPLRRLRSVNARAARCAVFMAPMIFLTACEPAVLDPQGVVGKAEKMLLIDSLAIMLAIVVPTIAATFAFAWWFRASNARARYLPDWAYSGHISSSSGAFPSS